MSVRVTKLPGASACPGASQYPPAGVPAASFRVRRNVRSRSRSCPIMSSSARDLSQAAARRACVAGRRCVRPRPSIARSGSAEQRTTGRGRRHWRIGSGSCENFAAFFARFAQVAEARRGRAEVRPWHGQRLRASSHVPECGTPKKTSRSTGAVSPRSTFAFRGRQ